MKRILSTNIYLSVFWMFIFLLPISACIVEQDLPLPPRVTAQGEETTKVVDVSSITARRYPRVDGSTSTYPLQFTIACQILNAPCVWYEGDMLDPTRRIILDLEYDGPDSVAERLYGLYHNGTHGSYMNLIDSKADLILVARQPSADEELAANRANIELEVFPIALDAFVFLAHAENPVEDLSLDQIRSIYTGEITEWHEVGGLDEPIHTYQRNENSGSQELMRNLVMGGEAMIESPEMILETMMGPISAISQDPLGLGYSVYYYAANMVPNEDINLLAVNGVEPTSETIGERQYPLTTEVYAVVRGDTPRHYGAGLLLEWLLTDEGQAAIAESGYIPISP